MFVHGCWHLVEQDEKGKQFGIDLMIVDVISWLLHVFSTVDLMMSTKNSPTFLPGDILLRSIVSYKSVVNPLYSYYEAM